MKKKIAVYTLLVLSVLSLLFFVYVLVITRNLPDVRQLEKWKPPEASVIYDYKGRVYSELYVQKRYYVPIDKIPDNVKKAFIATEDKNFYNNIGVDFFGIFRAFVKNIISGGITEGGSTISQQLVKNLFLTPEKSINRKIKEIILAVKLNRYYSKDKILELYLNQIYLGQGSYGVEAASLTYFGKHIWEVNLCEAAVLAGLPKAPSRYNPYANLDLAEKRKLVVLERMLDEGYISQEEVDRCKNQPIKLVGKSKTLDFDYFTETVRQFVIDKYGEEAIISGGLKIYTTIDKDLQIYAQKRLQEKLEIYQGTYGFPKLSKDEEQYLRDKFESQKVGSFIDNYIYVAKVLEVKGKYLKFQISEFEKSLTAPYQIRGLQVGSYVYVKYLGNDNFKIVPFLEGAIVSIDSKSGEIRALVGGYDILKSQFNRIFQSKRQPGSAIKPLIYASAILKGYTQISILKDEPISFFDYSQGKEWTPKNYDGNYYGNVTLRTALAKSLNAATVYLLSEVGFDDVINLGYKLGIKQKLPPYYSLALGSIELTPIELATMYSTFGNQGTKCQPFYIKKIVNQLGEVLYSQEPVCEAVYPQPENAVMVDLLRAVTTEGTAAAASSLPFQTAGKTGTTNNYADAWFAGFDPDLTTVVWIGYDKRRTIGKGVAGATVALPIWMDVMAYANKGSPYKEFPRVEGTVYIPIDPITLKVANDNCPGKYLLFVNGTYPTVDCEGNQVDISSLLPKKDEPLPEKDQTAPTETSPETQNNPEIQNNPNESQSIIDIIEKNKQ
ncbi:MAG: PBP1A family penicillin-binding protein [Hydrogenothermaceae bacterium]